jgi:hypothetical protein
VDLSHLPEDAIEKTHSDQGVILEKPGELGSPANWMGPPYTESPPGSGVWVPDHRPSPPDETHPAGIRREVARFCRSHRNPVSGKGASGRTADAKTRYDHRKGSQLADVLSPFPAELRDAFTAAMSHPRGMIET